jgi:hypothetical protein
MRSDPKVATWKRWGRWWLASEVAPPYSREVSESSVRVGIETTPRKSFASALDWPGWSRSGKTPELALEALLAYAGRYAVAADLARLALPGGPVRAAVEETTEGNATSAFGAPAITFGADHRPTDEAEARRLAALVSAAWERFEQIVVAAPAELRKGPRGGGRDTAMIVEHVVGAEQAYGSRMGLRLRAPDSSDSAAVAAFRAPIVELLSKPSDGRPIGRWTQRYAARRIAWHALDHAWEIEDRSGA